MSAVGSLLPTADYSILRTVLSYRETPPIDPHRSTTLFLDLSVRFLRILSETEFMGSWCLPLYNEYFTHLRPVNGHTSVSSFHRLLSL